MKLNVAVFFGGQSVEHEVSIISAHQAIESLDKEKYNVLPIYISKDQKLYFGEALFNMETFKNLDAIPTITTHIDLVNQNNQVEILPVKTSLFGKKVLGTIDVAIPVMHGTYGEDGTIQGYFEMLKVPYAGCDLFSAAVGQDKVLQKHILHDAGLPITNWFWVYAREMDDDPVGVLTKVRKLIYPVILKPARTGSSVGISIAHNDDEYRKCFEEARQYDEKIITEKVVKPMREINCSVLGDQYNAMVSALEEVNHGDTNELLDFKDKYLQGGNSSKQSQGMASTSRIVPAPISDGKTKDIQELALKTFKILGASGVCRVDFMMDAETSTVYVNEINTIPGSLAFYLWKETGVSFPELMDKLVEQALERERRRSRMTFSYETNILENYSSQSAKGAKQ